MLCLQTIRVLLLTLGNDSIPGFLRLGLVDSLKDAGLFESFLRLPLLDMIRVHVLDTHAYSI